MNPSGSFEPGAPHGHGALEGLRVLEFGSTGPGPFCAMMLADHGADVARVDRRNAGGSITPASDPRHELVHRNRRSIQLDLKTEKDLATALGLVARADVVIEGNRPGVMERLGLGPDVCLDLNPRLVYARVTGWGQDGPYAQLVGHDLNYLSIAGTLSLIGRRDGPPTIPLALVGDFGAGGMLAAFGIMAALWERERSGEGQIVDASILDGAALLATAFHGYRQTGGWSESREDNLVDGGAPFYDVYETSDHLWVSVAALEPRFYTDLLAVLGLEGAELPPRDDKNSWPELHELFAATFATKTRLEWVDTAEGTEACLSPVLSLEEARADDHIAARGTIGLKDGLFQPSPAPRFSRSAARLKMPPPIPGQHSEEVLRDWGSG